MVSYSAWWMMQSYFPELIDFGIHCTIPHDNIQCFNFYEIAYLHGMSQFENNLFAWDENHIEIKI